LIGSKGSTIFAEGEQAYARRRNQAAKLPGFMNVIKITPEKIEYLDTTLRAKGYAVKHVLECEPSPGSCFSG
jgi:hypothetical protein